MTQIEWAKKEEYYVKRLQEIIIPEDIDPAQVKRITSMLDRLRSEAFMDYVNAKRNYTTIDQKIELIMRSTVKGANDIQRRANQYLAAKEYQNDLSSDPINLFDIKEVYYQRFVFMTSLMYMIKDKADSLITDSNVLATESRLVM